MKRKLDIPFEVQKFITAMAERLPQKTTAYERKPYLELWKVSVEYYLVPVKQPVNHVHKMRIAFLANGATGLLEYIEPYILNKARFEQIRKVILAIA